MTLTIGLITPPVGVCLFVAMKLSGLDIFKLSRAVGPFLLAEVVVVLAMVLFPSISTGLVELLRR
jgi:TRAP-type C4-dicarboxylate transport system permease large subunit